MKKKTLMTREVALQLVSNDGCALNRLEESFKKDREIVLKAAGKK